MFSKKIIFSFAVTIPLVIVLLISGMCFSRSVNMSYSNGITVENNQIINEIGQISMRGTWSKKLDIFNFNIITSFNGSITFKGNTYQIEDCGLASHNGKKRFIGSIYRNNSDENSIYYIVMSSDFKQICLNSKIDRSYTIAPASTIEEYYRIDKLLW